MTTTRKQYSPKFKAKLAMQAIRGERTLSQLASQYHVHPVQIDQWRKTALEQLAELFVDEAGSEQTTTLRRTQPAARLDKILCTRGTYA
jgi:transposase